MLTNLTAAHPGSDTAAHPVPVPVAHPGPSPTRRPTTTTSLTTGFDSQHGPDDTGPDNRLRSKHGPDNNGSDWRAHPDTDTGAD